MTRADLPSICDLCDAYPDEARVADAVFRSFGGRSAFAGPAVTVQCLEDNALLASVLEEPGAARVLVVDAGGSMRRAVFGGNLGARALAHGWSGVLVHGAIRDVEELDRLAIGVLALGVCPMRPHKSGAGKRDVPVRFAGIEIAPGDWIYADRNGLIAAPRALA
jgi:regulator of ribonuclease activity A